jgi:hypothetical protein
MDLIECGILHICWRLLDRRSRLECERRKRESGYDILVPDHLYECERRFSSVGRYRDGRPTGSHSLGKPCPRAGREDDDYRMELDGCHQLRNHKEWRCMEVRPFFSRRLGYDYRADDLRPHMSDYRSTDHEVSGGERRDEFPGILSPGPSGIVLGTAVW